MLQQRIVTALALVAIIGGPVFLLPLPGFVVLAVIVFALAAWEWAPLCDIHARPGRLAYVCAISALIIILNWLCEAYAGENSASMRSLMTVAGIWWALALLWIQTHPQSRHLWQAPAVRMLAGAMVLVPSCLAFVWLRGAGPYVWVIVYLVAAVAAADIGAYFVGRRFGTRKLAPQVSPGKSWEGVFGGLAAVLLFAILTYSLLSLPFSLGQCLAISVVAGLASVLGDLWESMMKRHAGVKDSGSILPGHGGLLDRIDGWTAAAPLFVLCLLSLGWPK